MNKFELIKNGIEENKQKFGRWHSEKQQGSCDPRKFYLQPAPKNEHETLQHGNALSKTGNYPVGTSECFNVGISGGCGLSCFVYKKGACPHPEDMEVGK